VCVGYGERGVVPRIMYFFLRERKQNVSKIIGLFASILYPACEYDDEILTIPKKNIIN